MKPEQGVTLILIGIFGVPSASRTKALITCWLGVWQCSLAYNLLSDIRILLLPKTVWEFAADERYLGMMFILSLRYAGCVFRLDGMSFSQ